MSLLSRAKKLGAMDIKPSTRARNKWMVLYKGQWIHFGARGMSDYTIHKDEDRRRRYRARHSKIKLSDGRRAYTVKSSPSYWSWNLLW